MKRILLIEDDQAILRILGRWLASAGYVDIRTAQTGRDGLAAIAEQSWDLVISDICLPDMTGIDIANETKLREPGRRFLLMTGNLTSQLSVRAMQTLNPIIDAFLPKPVSKSDFLSKVEQLLDTGTRAQERVLAIGAHPDDVEIGCGGILISHQEQGDALCILTLSQGACGGRADARAQESKHAARLLNAELILENLEDTRISEGPETIGAISRAIEAFRPTIVYTHSLNDAHQDHRNVHLASIVAARQVKSVECYQSPSSTIRFMPTRFVDIGKQLGKKQALIGCYGSQVNCRDYLKESMIEATAEYWGRFAGFKKVEPLEVVRSA